MIFRYVIPLLFVSFLFQLANSSSCGSGTIPFSFEALADGQPLLGCFRPACFGWSADSKTVGSSINFTLINNRLDGYIHESNDDIPKEISAEDAQYFKPQLASCEPNFASRRCKTENQWVGGILPSNNVSEFPLAIQCCEYEPLKNSEDRGIAIVKPGQIVIGGAIVKEERQYGFDYISNIVTHKNENRTVSYEVSVRRMACIPHPKELTVKIDNSLLNEIENNFGNNGAQAFQAPIVGGEQSQPLQEISSVGSQQGSQPALARAAETYNPSGYVDSSYNSAGYGNSYSYGSSQGSGYSAVNTQGSGSSSGYFPDCPSLFCFSADTTIKLSNGQTKRIDELNINDWVLSANTSQIGFASVDYWLHKMPKIKAEFIRIELTDGNILKITSKHYIYKTECSNENELIPFDKINHIPVFAENVNVGDCLYVTSEKQEYAFEERRVQKIDIVEDIGIYAPMTSNSNIIVNDIFASCLNIIDNKVMQDTFIYNVKKLPSLGSIFGENEKDETELPYGTSLVVELMTYVLPNSVYVV